MAGQVPGVRLGAVQASHERRTPPSPPLRLTAIVDQQFSVKIDQYGGDKPRFLACIAALALQDEAREIIYKVGEKKGKNGNAQRSVSAFEDATAGNAKERKVQRLDGEMPAGTSFGNWM